MVEYGIGRSLWLKTDTVVILHKQMRIVDIEYNNIFMRLRSFSCPSADHELLLTRVIGSEHCPVKTLDDPNWRDAQILVFSNEVRQEFNNHIAISRAHETNTKLIVCVAEDVVKINSYQVPKSCSNILKSILKISDDKTDDLPGLLPLVSNMPIILTENISTQLGLTNGTNGIFKSLLYEDDEESENNDNEENDDLIFPKETTIFIRKPLCAIVEIQSSKINGVFEGLKPKLIPIPLTQGYFNVSSKQIFPDSLKNLFQKPFNLIEKRNEHNFRLSLHIPLLLIRHKDKL